ncbi:prepilin-type N-terminal cleavage/methylation domain-containing protein [Kurthia gibsonii]|uniref:type II secretion system protein n=1 Tax=Kurthia gibsonii TaxID=33946 RepID=UPI000EABEA04|nr:prepilin-type N-terminal cleavage/methylation domain-containing protein [Kurthia gibsonii]RXH52865.1 prepilin-type N-terminal cleavage/methylation domain-containing protein [Kurthia gibsonii]
MKNEKGFTLVEVLAVIVILAIVGSILFNLLTSSNKEYKSQVDDTTNLNELSFIMKEITRDFRKTKIVDIQNNQVVFKTKENNQEKVIATYTKTGDTLSKNGSPYQTKIRSFCVQSTKEPSKSTSDCLSTSKTPSAQEGIYLNIENTNGKRVETTLYSRGG